MTKNKYMKLLILVICIVFVLMSVTSVIMAGNVLHVENCNDDHCHICTLIHIATDFIKNIELIVFDVLIFSVLILMLLVIENNVKVLRRPTLVELKVVQNK